MGPPSVSSHGHEEADEDERGIGSPGEELGVGEVGEAKDPHGEGETDRAERDDRPAQDPVREVLEEHQPSAPEGPPAPRRPRNTAPRSAFAASFASPALEPVAALDQHVATIRDPEGGARVLLDHEHRDPSRREPPHEIEDLRGHPRGEPGRRLVEEDQLRFGNEGAREREHLALAAGEDVRLAVLPLAEDRERRVGGVEPGGRGAARHGARRPPGGSRAP